MTLDEHKTNWFIAEAAKYGINVAKRYEAPNGGEAITFDMPQNITQGKKRPYFMIWTGDGKEYKWHVEFGHYYMPRNEKERRGCRTTEYFPDEELADAIKKYAEEIKNEND